MAITGFSSPATAPPHLKTAIQTAQVMAAHHDVERMQQVLVSLQRLHQPGGTLSLAQRLAGPVTAVI